MRDKSLRLSATDGKLIELIDIQIVYTGIIFNVLDWDLVWDFLEDEATAI